MWNRRELKAKGKAAFKANYWKSVFITLLVGTLIAGGSGLAGGFGFSNIFNINSDKVDEAHDKGYEEGYRDGYEDGTGSMPGGDFDINEWFGEFGDPDEWIDQFGDDDIPDIPDGYMSAGEAGNVTQLLSKTGGGNISRMASPRRGMDIEINGLDDLVERFGPLSGAAAAAVLIVVVLVIIVITVIVMALSLLYDALIVNPMDAGRKKFYLANRNSAASVKEVAYAFDTNYKNIAKVLFFRSLFTMLWSLLFIIPGIIKHYEYLMMPYIMTEDPNISREQAFAVSKAMMTGNKWKTFVLDLSFIGWFLLSLITCGIVGVFYANPYFDQTKAELYVAIKGEYAARFAR